MINSQNQIKDHYDCLIIGGGIVGAGIYRDLSLNGVSTLLIDKKDFSSQTSSKSSKMLHGGIRYLENMDFDLVFEALHEKNLWLRIAPHLCFESPFYLPIFSDSLRPKWMIRCGLFLYDLLSSFHNKPFFMTNKDQTVKALPDIRSNGLIGAGVYHDAIVDDARLTIEVIADGSLNSDCDAINHTSLKSFRFNGNTVTATIIDELSNTEKTVTANEIVFATGPFTDELLIDHPDFKWSRKLLPSKGSHLWLKKDSVNISSPLVLTPKDGRVIFVIPQRNHILIGTTEVEYNGNKFDMQVSDEEVDYLLANLNEYFPNAKVNHEHVVGKFAGLRPLVKEDDTNDRAKTARNHKYYQPKHNMHVILGGKYTTFRVMAKEVASVICKKLNTKYNSTLSMSPFRYKSGIRTFSDQELTEEIINAIKTYEHVRCPEDLRRRTSLP
ncbi:glycerol-3-phosphate dehydrogenase/oxidase [Bacteriovorax sp. Seq25_V]|uniref:glycerol-3-phosphate dehydrogenase/oxidase n=1 Tax=Bacteriovorax sp. Seq25_V TaxID=1201288 RepID=UPI00038A03DA|nr:glycerol-3-phosphate dehydrogenase/oxidase [Bacteriovorax sp. Seq25_V]EQC46311.1 FAD dependent oxidoreductase [Bacteriovorax sp. Seq25_V]